jgi:Tfp pilus assembly protein PilF
MWKLVVATLVFLAVIVATVLSYMGYTSNTADKYLKEGFVQFQQQKYDAAIQNYEKAIASGVRSPSAYNMLGLAYRYKNQQGKVCDPKLEESEIVYFEMAVDVDPKYQPAVLNLAYTY